MAKVKVRRASSSAALPGAKPQGGLGVTQFGQTGLKRSYGYVYEELLPQLQGRKAISVFQEMSQNSAIIGAMLFAIDMFMRKVAWRVEAASDSGVDKKKAEFLSSCKDDMEHTWGDFVAEVNSMLVFGWSWFEVVYKQRYNTTTDEFGSVVSKWDDGMIGWKKFMPIAQESWWRWDFDPESGQTIGMWQRPAPDYSERYLPLGKSLHFRTTSKKENPEGVSILRTAYRAWYFLKRIEEIEAIGVERDLAGIPIATVPAEMLGAEASANDKAMVQAIMDLVQNVRRDEQEGIVWPQAYDEGGHELYTFKLLTSGGTRQFPTQEIITRYESRIAMTALTDFLLLGNDTSSPGSYALATSKSSMFQSALETWLNVIESVINDRAVPLLFRMNGINSGPYPQFRHDIVQKPTLTDLSTLISSMAGAGAQLFPDIELENHLREFAELPAKEPNPADQATEEQIMEQQLQTLLESAKAEEQMAIRTGKDAKAEGIVPVPQGSIVEAAALSQAAPAAPAPGTAASGAAGTSGTGVGGKQKGSASGAPTKSTGPVKSTKPPAARRGTVNQSKDTAGARAAKNAPPKATGGLKNRSVAKHFSPQDTGDVRKRVMQQMKPNFPKHSMQWMKDYPWTGPEMVPTEMFDTSDENNWAAAHEPDKVKAFVKRVKDGAHKPIVAAKVPGSNKLRIIDGHHHFKAYDQLGYPAPAYVVHTDKNFGPWDETHSFQKVSDSPTGSGYESGDKGGGVKKSTPKATKQAVDYRPSTGPRACGNCSMFKKSSGTCSLVIGHIEPQDVCDEWNAKPGLEALQKKVSMMTVKNPQKKCDYCQRDGKKLFVQDGAVIHRSCNLHTPQARADIRWSANNQVSPVNPQPYEPFPRVITQ